MNTLNRFIISTILVHLYPVVNYLNLPSQLKQLLHPRFPLSRSPLNLISEENGLGTEILHQKKQDHFLYSFYLKHQCLDFHYDTKSFLEDRMRMEKGWQMVFSTELDLDCYHRCDLLRYEKEKVCKCLRFPISTAFYFAFFYFIYQSKD